MPRFGSHKDIYRGSSIDEDRGGEKKRKKEEEEECFGPGLTGIISDTVLSVDAVWARGPTERRAGDLWPRLSLSLECIVAGCYVKYGRVPEVKNNKRRKRKTYIYIYIRLFTRFPLSDLVPREPGCLVPWYGCMSSRKVLLEIVNCLTF